MSRCYSGTFEQLRQLNLETLFGVWSTISGYNLEINYYMQFTRNNKSMAVWRLFNIAI